MKRPQRGSRVRYLPNRPLRHGPNRSRSQSWFLSRHVSQSQSQSLNYSLNQSLNQSLDQSRSRSRWHSRRRNRPLTCLKHVTLQLPPPLLPQRVRVCLWWRLTREWPHQS